MKTGIFLVLFVSLVFASFLEPPFERVKENNLNVIADTKEFSDEVVGTELVYFVNVTLLTLDPSVDNRINYGRLPEVLWISKVGYLSSFEDRIITYPTGTCENRYSKRAWELVGYRKEILGKFYFRNITKEIEINSNNFVMPFTNEELADSENDTVLVNISGDFKFDYNVQYIAYTDFFGECLIDEEINEVVTITKNASSSREYIVEGKDTLHFLQKPVLKEQWFMNNRFDVILLANRELKRIEVRKNNSTIGNAILHEFEIETNESGIQKIISNQTKSNNGTQANKLYTKTLPKQLEEKNKTFYIVYQINSSYEGIGNNTLELFLVDDFGGEIKIEEQLLSRALSNGELMVVDKNETGLSRQNFVPEEKGTDIIYLQFGAIGLLVLVIFRKLRI